MSDTIHVVTGATGNIGRALAANLLERDLKVRAVGRSTERLQGLADQGAELAVGSLEDEAFASEALENAGVAWLMIPPGMMTDDLGAYQSRVVQALVGAVSEAGVSHVLSLSSVGAHRTGNGPIDGLHELEGRLDELGDVNAIHLRPCFFMENHMMNIGMIKKMGANGSPVRPDLSIPMIATRDIAAVASELMAGASFEGHSVRELLGPGEHTMTEATRVLGEAIGKPELPYQQLPYEVARKAMVEMGISESFADAALEMYKSMNEGNVAPTQARSAETTTPTTLEEFARDFAAAYGSG